MDDFDDADNVYDIDENENHDLYNDVNDVDRIYDGVIFSTGVKQSDVEL